MTKIKTALISVFNKDGILSFAQTLDKLGVKILSTGGTAKLLREAGIAIAEVADVTGFPEMLDGRVKTLHPRIHGGILALRDNPGHTQTLAKHKIGVIDLVVVNLYPFAEAARTKTVEADIIEMIDIGGPSMLRSAAKNHRFVAAVCDPADYGPVARELEKSGGALSDATRRRLAGKVFRTTSAYDRMIADHVGGTDTFQIQLKKHQDLRYGENPHQKAALYAEAERAGVPGAKQLQGKELSFNNILDLDAAWEMARAFPGPACAVVKHTCPCGFALGPDIREAFRFAWACDPLSAFGSIIGVNRPVDGTLAKDMLAAGFIECVIAPSFSNEALSAFAAKKNLRLMEAGAGVGAALVAAPTDYKKITGGLLVQDADLRRVTAADLKTVTKKKPTAAQVRDMLFAFDVCRFVKSNAIIVAKNGRTLGLGMGQPSRVDACRAALRKAGKRARGAVLASDGFFPMPDSIALAKRHGIAAIIQPGGSIKDGTVIRACDRARIPMVFTGVRHFKH